MKLKIKLLDPSLQAPKYETTGAVAFDLCARIDVTIKPFLPTIVPLNVVIKVPTGYVILLAARSSLPLKKQVMVANSIGIIDQDYCGEDDEIGLQLLNFTKKAVTIKRGERIAQAMMVKISKVSKFQTVTKMNAKTRGGFGSTG